MNWIDATKEVPILKHDVLVTDGERIGIGDYTSKGKFYPNGAWSIQGSNYFEPTHWMELPELPKSNL